MKTLRVIRTTAIAGVCSLILVGSFTFDWTEEEGQPSSEAGTNDLTGEPIRFEPVADFPQSIDTSELLRQQRDDVYSEANWRRQQEQWRIEEQVNEDMHRWEFYRNTRF